MTHEQKVKALIEAGRACPPGDWLESAPRVLVADTHQQVCWSAGKPKAHFIAMAGCARDSIKLLAEIAEAAGELMRANMALSAATIGAGHAAEAYARVSAAHNRLDALLAKYKEAQDAE